MEISVNQPGTVHERMNRMSRRILISVLVLTSISLVALAADLNGRWEGKLSIPGGGDEMTIAFTFKVDGDKVTGSVEGPMGTMPISNGKITGDDFTFTVDFEGNAMPHKGKITGDTVKITVEGEMASACPKNK
jgi:hypothetical protein